MPEIIGVINVPEIIVPELIDSLGFYYIRTNDKGMGSATGRAGGALPPPPKFKK